MYDNHIEDDEFHPDPRRAAVHADRKAVEASFRWVVNELNRELAKKPKDKEKIEQLTNRREELADILTKEDDEDGSDE